MSDKKEEAHKSYIKLQTYRIDTFGSGEDNDAKDHIQKQREQISLMILQFLYLCGPQERFAFKEFPTIIFESSHQDGFDGNKAAEAFINLEHYLLLIYLMPWKEEFHKIKKFSGFYQSKIESHLRRAELVFRLVGFTEMMGVLMLTQQHEFDQVLQVAFECLVASVECQLIADIHQQMKKSVSFLEIVRLRFNHGGSTKHMVTLLESQQEAKSRGSNVADGRMSTSKANDSPVALVAKPKGSTDPFRNKLQEHIKVAKKISSRELDIPFIDEDVDVKEPDNVVGNFEDHLLASLQIVGDKEAVPVVMTEEASAAAGMRGSEEWSFVRKGLEKNYGKKYFEGPRKDILTGGTIDGQSSGHGTYNTARVDMEVNQQVPVRNNASVSVPAKHVFGAAEVAAVRPQHSVNRMQVQPNMILTPQSGDSDTMQVQPNMILTPQSGDSDTMQVQPNMIVTPQSGDSDTMQVQPNMIVTPQSGDSAYTSETSTLYPPTVPEFHPTVNRPVVLQKVQSDVIGKRPAITTTQSAHSRTEPIATKRHTSDTEIRASTFPGNRSNDQVFSRGSKNVNNMENIKAYQKRSSLPGSYLTGDNVQRNAPISSSSVTIPAQRSVGTGNIGNRPQSGSQLSKPVMQDKNVLSKSSYVKVKPVNISSSNPTSSGKWSCHSCTFINASSAVVCDMCSKSRDGQPEVDSPAAGHASRVCDKCTLENETGSEMCHACGNQLRGTQTVV